MIADRLVLLVVPALLVAYTPVAFGHRWWISGVSAPLVAWLLLRRHRRARFSAYVLLTVIVLRSVVAGPWWLVAAAVGVIAVLQTPPARRAWPRLQARGPAGGAGPR